MVRQITVLIIEDIGPHSYLVKTLLRGQYPNCKIIEAKTGEVGLEEFKEHSIDVVFVDINLPGINGFDVIQTIRKTKKGKTLPIIAMSAYREPMVEEYALKDPYAEFIDKPIDPETFATQIGEYIK